MSALIRRRTSTSSWPKSSRNERSAARTRRSSSSVSSMVCISGAYSEGPAGLVAPAARADGDHRHALGPGYRDASRLRVEAEEHPLVRGHVLALDPVDARSPDDDVDLLLAAGGLVVLPALRVRRDLEPVDPERLTAEPPPDEANRAAGPSPSRSWTSTTLQPI